jgi:hypothetical protein
MNTKPLASKSEPDPKDAEDQVKINPWLIGFGVIAVVIGVLAGWLMSQATLIR